MTRYPSGITDDGILVSVMSAADDRFAIWAGVRQVAILSEMPTAYEAVKMAEAHARHKTEDAWREKLTRAAAVLGSSRG